MLYRAASTVAATLLPSSTLLLASTAGTSSAECLSAWLPYFAWSQ